MIQPPEATTTLLFTDLVKSTELLAKSGDDAAQGIFRAHHALLREAVAAHRGHEVKWLGDGLMVAFPSAAEAARCAIAMQRAARRPVVGERLAIRVGLQVGEPLREENDYFGTPVVVAQRLCARAKPAQILCSHLVAGLLAGRPAFRFRELGRMLLKGIPQTLRVSELLYEEDASPSDSGDDHAPSGKGPQLPLPPRLARSEQFPFVGRRREIDLLTTAWDRAAAGTRRVILVKGEPGIGKTRLAAEIARVTHSVGGMVLFGRCDEELGVPFQPFVEALEYFVSHSPDAGLRGHLGPYAGELVRLVPEIAHRLPGLAPMLCSDPETERYRLFEAVARWLATASAERPILLVLDDLHWAAKPTVLLLRHVTSTGTPARLMIIGTHRHTEVNEAHPLVALLADLRNVPGVEQMALPGLDEVGVIEFLEQASGRPLRDVELGFAHAVHTETAGNPLFVAEVLRHLTESGAIVQGDGRWVATRGVTEIEIPAAVRDVVLRRVRRLSAAANETVTLASVIGPEFDLGTLAAIGRLGEEALLAALDEAVAARLVDETAVDAYRFAHALVHSALYNSLSASRRVRLHRRVAEALEVRRPEDVTALAHHYMHAGADQIAKAIDYATRAGDLALIGLAHDQAVHFYQRALGLLDASVSGDPSQRCELLIRLGGGQRNAGDPVHRETLLEAAHLAERLHDTDRLVRAALANNRGWVSASGAVDRERVLVLEASVAALDDTDSASRAMLLATLAGELAYASDRPRRVALSDAALAMARRIGSPATLAHVLNLRGHAIWAPETLPERLANTAEHVAVAAQLGDPLARWYASATRPQACMEAGDIEEVDRHLAILLELTQELGHPHLRWAATIDRAWRVLLAGRLGEAEALASEAHDIGTSCGQRDALGYYTGQLTAIRFDQGRLGEMAGPIEQIVARYPRIPLLPATLSLAYCELDQPAEARRLLEAAFDARFEHLPLDVVWLTEMALHAAVCARLGAPAPAALLYERLAPWRDHVVFNGLFVFGSTAHLLGSLAATLGRYDEADAHFVAATAVHERIGAPTLLARTRLERAHMLLARRRGGDAVQARTLLGQALAAAHELGLAGVERSADSLLAA